MRERFGITGTKLLWNDHETFRYKRRVGLCIGIFCCKKLDILEKIKKNKNAYWK